MPNRYLFFISQDYSFPVLRPLQVEILARGDSVAWFLYGDELHYDFLRSDEKRLYTIDEVVEFNPHAVFVPGNVVPSFIPGLKVEVFHGLPSAKTTKSGQLYHFIIREMFDLYCTQGPSSTDGFLKLAKEYENFSVVETGWCKLDPLFERLLSADEPRKKAVFVASTFSPRFSKAKILHPLLVSMMQKYEIDWYVTLHPKMEPLVVEMYKSIDLPNVKFVESTELIEYFAKSDMMLCDTSSIIYEFLTQLKPVITFQTETPQPQLVNVEDIDKLEAAILSTLNNPDINRKNIEASVREFHPYTDGKSSARVLDAVENMLGGNNLPQRKKPLNLFRNFKLRRELNYWKW